MKVQLTRDCIIGPADQGSKEPNFGKKDQVVDVKPSIAEALIQANAATREIKQAAK